MNLSLKRKGIVHGLVAVAMLAATLVPALTASAAVTWPLQLKVNGSTTVNPIAQDVKNGPYNANFPDTNVDIASTGSGVGIAALLDGTVDVAMSSRDTKSSDATGKPYGLADLNKWVVAKDAIVPVVHQSSLSMVDSLTTAQLKSIYQCEAGFRNWSQINPAWPNQDIVVIARETTSGTFGSWLEILGISASLENSCVTTFGQRGEGNPGVQAAVAAAPYSVGYVGLGFVDYPGIRPIKAGGVEGSVANVNNGTYPISRKLYMMTLKFAVNPRPATYARGIDFINQTVSAAGQALVAAEGFVPLSGTREILKWDVNVDGTTNITDITLVGQKWLQSEGASHGGWIRQDVNRDGVVNISDITTIGQHWLETWTFWTE